MNRIPNDTNYTTSPFGGGNYTEPSFDSNSSGFDTQDPRIRSWLDQIIPLRQIYQQMIRGNSPYKQMAMTYLQQVDSQASQYAGLNFLSEDSAFFGSSGSNWDPLSGNIYGEGDTWEMGSNGISQGTLGQPGPSFPIAWQDSTHVVTDEGSEFNYTVLRNDSETRSIDAYQPSGKIVLPSNAMHASVSEQNTENGVAKVLTIHFLNGGTRVIRFYGKDLSIQAADPTQVVKEASLTSDVSVTSLEDPTEASPEVKGDPPTSHENGQEVWDMPNAAVYPSGNGKEGKIFVTGNVTFHASSTRDYWTVKWDTSMNRYVVEVYKDAARKELKNRYAVDDMVDQISFSKDIEKAHLKFEAPLGKAPDYNDIDTTNTQGKKLEIGEGDDPSNPGDGEALNPYYPKETGESFPHETQGNTATYDQDPKITIHTYYDDNVDHHYITAQDSVDIYPSTQADEVSADYVDPQDPHGKIQLIYSYKDASGTNHTEYYIIDPTVASIDPHTAKLTGTAAHDPKIKHNGVSTEDYPEGLKDFLAGKTEDQILLALKTAGYTEYQGTTDFVKAAKDGNFPPNPPDSKLIKLLPELDPNLKSALESAGFAQTFDEKKIKLKTAGDQMVALLTKLYPGIKISDTLGYAAGDVCFIGFKFDQQYVSVDMTKSKKFETTVSPPWPTAEKIHSVLPSEYWNTDLTDRFIAKVDMAMQTGDWTNVNSFLWNDLAELDVGNDIIRTFVGALYAVAGNDLGKLKGLLRLVPKSVRIKMIRFSTEPAQKGQDNQDHFDTQDTIGIIRDTL